MAKICHITTVHRPNDIRIFWKECITLAQAGHDVSLIALNAQSETVEGIKIIGIPFAGNGRIRRMIGGVNAVYRKALRMNADIYHFHDPEFLRAGKKLKSHGKIVIYDCHEDVSRQVMNKDYLPKWCRGLLSKIVRKLEHRYSSKLSAIIVTISEHLKRFNDLEITTETIFNYPMLDEIHFNSDWSKRSNEICYIGGLFPSRGIMELVKAMEQVDWQLKLAGKYSSEQFREQLILEKGWSQVNELGFINRNGVTEVLNHSRIGICTLHPTPSYLEAFPTKIFEYMAAGIPVIASNFALHKTIVEDNKCGICVNPLDPTEIAKAINSLIADQKTAEQMGLNGRKTVLEKYSWYTEGKKLLKLYDGLIKMKKN